MRLAYPEVNEIMGRVQSRLGSFAGTGVTPPNIWREGTTLISHVGHGVSMRQVKRAAEPAGGGTVEGT